MLFIAHTGGLNSVRLLELVLQVLCSWLAVLASSAFCFPLSLIDVTDAFCAQHGDLAPADLEPKQSKVAVSTSVALPVK
jgi:hypothetical protein